MSAPRTGPPPPPDPRDARRLEDWLGQLRDSVAELARHQVALHRELSTLADAVESLRRGESPERPVAVTRSAASPILETPTASLPRRIARGLVHRALGVARRLRDVDLDIVSRHLDPDRRLAYPDDARVVDASSGEASSGEASSGKTSSGETLSGPPQGWIDAARLALAAEGLEFLELRGTHRALVARPTVLDEDGRLDARRLRALPADRVIGRRILVGGATAPADDPIGDATRAAGDAGHRVRAGARARRRRLEVAAGVPPSARQATSRAAVLLTAPPEAGVERLCRHAHALLTGSVSRDPSTAPWIDGLPVLCLVPDPRPVRDLGALLPLWTPLGDAFPEDAGEDVRAVAAVALLRHHGVSRVLHVGPGDGCFDRAVLLDTLEELEVVDLALPAYPGRAPLPRPPWIQHRLEMEDAIEVVLGDPRRAGLPPGERSTARAALGLGDDEPVVVLCADLVPAERPEDFVELAHRLETSERTSEQTPRPRCLLVGRGPLAGTVADLVHWRGLERFVLATDADPRLALAAADVVVSTAEHRPLPFALLDALRLGRPVVATEDVATEDVATEDGPWVDLASALDLPAPTTVPAADPDALARAVVDALVEVLGGARRSSDDRG